MRFPAFCENGDFFHLREYALDATKVKDLLADPDLKELLAAFVETPESRGVQDRYK